VAVSASVRPVPRTQVLRRAEYEAVFGLLLIAVMLVSTLENAVLAPAGRAILLGCFVLLAVVNVGAALGVYIGASFLFSLSISGGQFSWVQRPDNVALLFLTFYLVVGRCFTRSAGRFGSTAAAVALLLLTAVIHLIAIVGAEWYWLAWFARMFAIPLGLFVLLRRAALSSGEVRALLLIVAVLGVYLAAVTLLEVPGWYALIIPPWLGDPEFNPYMGSARVGGLAMQPEWNALDLSLAFCVLLLWLNQRRTRFRVGWLVGAGLCLVAIYFTYTRGALLGLVMGGLPLFWQQSAARGITFRRRVLFIVCILVFLACVLFLPGQALQGRMSDSNTMYFRFSIWLAGLRMVAEHPLFGVGFGQFASHLGTFVQDVAWIPSSVVPKGGAIAHNTLLSVAGELGLVGLSLYVLTVWGVYRSARAAADTVWGPGGRSWVAGFTLVYHTNIQFITAHWLSSNLLYFGVMGAIAGMRGSRDDRPRAVVGPAHQ
jgi:O-antigen ligase